MDSNTIRKTFLDFFKNKGHKIMPSSSLVDKTDPSVLLTSAGMQQFKPFFTGVKNAQKELEAVNIATSQKCFRTTDIDEVGDETHNTFFEMLGNFSFGGYYKKEAINYAYELIAQNFEINYSRITITIFNGDDNVKRDNESAKIWENLGFSEKNKNLKFCGKEDNFWGPTGEQGPCGPTTEIYVDGVEIWNIVFNEYNCDKNKKLNPLSKKGIDTGMGLERLTTVLQNKKNNFDTDLFLPIIEIVDKYSNSDNKKAKRIIADHLKSAMFLMAERLMPSNIKQGYILRRVLRRSMRYVNVLGISDYNIYGDIFNTIGNIYKDVYPELLKNKKHIEEIFNKEYNVFGKALVAGLKIFEKNIKNIENNVFKGENAFFLYSTYGFPIELIDDIAKEKGFIVDKIGFEKEINEHKRKSKQ
ncbi:MAG: alanine--tRNA ligase-related protein [Patescibacteria group bacterium]